MIRVFKKQYSRMINNKKYIVVFLLLLLLISLPVLTRLNAKDKAGNSSPLFYVKMTSISSLSSNFSMIAEILNKKIENPKLKLSLESIKSKLNIFQLMLNGIDVKSPVYFHFNIKKFNFKKMSLSLLSSLNPLNYFNVGIEIPLTDNSSAKKYISKIMATKFIDGVLKKDNITVSLDQDKMLLYTGTDSFTPKKNRKYIDALVNGTDKDNHLFYYKINFPVLENFFRTDILKYYLSLSDEEQKNYYNKAGASKIFEISYLLEFYSKFYLQNYKLASEPVSGWFDFTIVGEDTISFEGESFGTLADRTLFKEFLKSYSISYKKEIEKGHVYPKLDDIYVHLTIPLRIKDFINTLEKTGGTEVFLIRDTVSFLTSISDFVFMEDSKELFWKQLDSSMDFILYDLPDFKHKAQISAYKFLFIAGLKNKYALLRFLEKTRKRWKIYNISKKNGDFSLNKKSYQLKLMHPKIDWIKLKEGLYEIKIKNRSIFLGAGNGSVFIVRDLELAEQLLKDKAMSNFLRPALSFAKSKDENLFSSLPLAFKIDFNKIRNKMFTGKYKFMSSSSSFLPKLHYIQFRQGLKKNGNSPFYLEVGFN